MDFKTQKLVNQVFSMAQLLSRVGIQVERSMSIHCPFHEDGRRSAKYYAESDEIYCFAETRTYRAYDLLRLLGVEDKEIVKTLQKGNIKPVEKKRAIPPLFRGETEKVVEIAKKQFKKRNMTVQEYAAVVKEALQPRE